MIIKRYLKDQRGATAVEYAVIVALVVLLSIGVIILLEGQSELAFSKVGSTVRGFGKIQ